MEAGKKPGATAWLVLGDTRHGILTRRIVASVLMVSYQRKPLAETISPRAEWLKKKS